MPDDLDPKKYHVLDEKKMKIVYVVLAVLFSIFTPVLATVYYRFAISRPSQTSDEHEVEIEPGTGIVEIAGKLYEKDVINSKVLFVLYVVTNHSENDIQAGVYTIPAGISLKDLISILEHGTNDILVTFIEGWRVEEFALIASEKFDDVDYEDFVEMAIPYEGYLFPDTYLFSSDVTVEEMIDRLKDTFELKTKDILESEDLEELGFTKDEVVIMASLIEREVADIYDRPLVAGILVKRLREDTTLGVDATVQYYASSLRSGCTFPSDRVCPKEKVAREMDWWPYSLTQEELDYEADYNTRKYPGLPPKPISSTGISALESVLNYKETSYNFYLTDSEGVTYFSETLAEHQQNIELHLR